VSGRHRTKQSGTDYGSGLWPVLLSLLVVLVPTACVLWFLNEAVQNERLASRHKLLQAYRVQLPLLRDRLDAYWQQQSQALDAMAAESSAAETFAACVGGGIADSVVVYDASGRLSYPAPAAVPTVQPHEDDAWAEAGLLEHVRNEPAAAATAYGKIAETTGDDRLAARALQSQARCLVRTGRVAEAIHVLVDTLGQAKYARSLDAQGRLVAADAQLRALELIGDHQRRDFTETADRLAKCLGNYKTRLLPAAQRRFLMKEFSRLTAHTKKFPTLAAEELAVAYVESHPPSADVALRPSGLPGAWHFASPGGNIVGLFKEENVLKRTAAVLKNKDSPQDVQIVVLPPDAETDGGVEQLLSVGATMPGWRLALLFGDSQESQTAINHRIATNTWIAVLVITAMAIVAVFVAAAFRRQMRLTRLKNDLLATVSHELKTPLASIRLIVDTLLDAEQLDTPKAREYLQLVSKENTRLSRLIDNFLSFSRMERGKLAFEFDEVSAAEIADRAVEVMSERFQTPGCSLEVQLATNTPVLRADSDALVTAILNLLDNAYKYSGDSKHVVLRTYAENGNVCFAVSDNGSGLSSRAAKNVFRSFYQVDRRLSRNTGGCGLGLSIVQFIAEAHGGSISVESQLGAGSTFTLSIPQIQV